MNIGFEALKSMNIKQVLQLEQSYSPQENRGDTPTHQRSSKLTSEEGKVSMMRNGDTADTFQYRTLKFTVPKELDAEELINEIK